jgi:hypothetical protein
MDKLKSSDRLEIKSRMSESGCRIVEGAQRSIEE